MALDKVTVGVLADDAVATAKVADDAVTGAKIENNPTVAGNLTVTGNTTLSGTSTLTGNATASGNLTVTGDIVPSSPLSHRNVIYNGDCRVAQRGGTSTNPTSKPNTVDGFHYQKEGSPGNVTCTQATVSGTNAPGEFSKSFKVEQTSTVSSPGSTSAQIVMRKVEAYDCQQFNTATGTTPMVLSFWVKANYADTFTTAILNIDGVRIINFQYTTVANEWQKVTHLIPADSGSYQYDNNNDRGVELRWWLTAGANFIGNASTSWKMNNVNNTYNSYDNPAFSTDGREWEITGVQLEHGSSATPFEHKSYADELHKCQRYFYQHTSGGSDKLIGKGGWNSSSQFEATVHFKTAMRVPPALIYGSGTNYYRVHAGGSTCDFDDLNIHARNILLDGGCTATSLYKGALTGGGSGLGRVGNLVANHSSAYVHFDSEIA